MTFGRMERLYNNMINYIMEMADSRSDMFDTFKVIGFTVSELIEAGFDDIENYIDDSPNIYPHIYNK